MYFITKYVCVIYIHFYLFLTSQCESSSRLKIVHYFYFIWISRASLAWAVVGCALLRDAGRRTGSPARPRRRGLMRRTRAARRTFTERAGLHWEGPPKTQRPLLCLRTSWRTSTSARHSTARQRKSSQVSDRAASQWAHDDRDRIIVCSTSSLISLTRGCHSVVPLCSH